ncbi:hypothetical protein F4781DRAFT_355039 [Annulohypoxylon bovei var. microspora]|nr:hypothetical protein F4781DRAFT_355039 [Annulohypoxylon bovei var. microspora]
MGCFGIFSLLRKNSEQASSTSSRRSNIYVVPDVPKQVSQSRGRAEMYESSQIRVVKKEYDIPRAVHRSPYAVLRKASPERGRRYTTKLPRRSSNESNPDVVIDGREAFRKHTRNRKTWWESTHRELRDGFKSCHTKAPRIDVDFLWQDRRDSLDEESILAARGLKAPGPSQGKPRRSCKLDCLCPRCIAALFKEHPRSSVNPCDIKLKQKHPKPSKIPRPPSSTRSDSSSRHSSRVSSRNASPSSTNRQRSESENNEQQNGSRKASGSSKSGISHRARCDSESEKGEKGPAESWWQDDLNPSYSRGLKEPNYLGQHKYPGEWRFIR